MTTTVTNSSSAELSRTRELLRSALRSTTSDSTPDGPHDWAAHLGRDRAGVEQCLLEPSAGPPVFTATTELFPDEALVSGGMDLLDTEVELVPATDHMRWRLGCDDRTMLLVRQRGSWDEMPLWVRRSYHVVDPQEDPDHVGRAAGIAAETRSLAEAFLRFFGVAVGRITSTFEAVRSDETVARPLGITAGSVVLFRETTVRDVTGRPRVLSYTHFRADRVGMFGAFADQRNPLAAQ